MPRLNTDTGCRKYIDYNEFESSFAESLEITPAHVRELADGMRRTLRGKEKRTALESDLLALSEGNGGVMELVAKEHESLAFLASLDHLCAALDGAGVPLKRDAPLGAQLAELTEHPKFRELASRHVMDPLFRKGIHAAERMTTRPDGRETSASAQLARFDTALNQTLMEKTLAPPSPEQLQALKSELDAQGRGERVMHTVLQNQEQQRLLAKMLFLGHIAGVTVNRGNETKPYESAMADLFTHGGRVTVTLPAGTGQTQFDAIVGANGGDSAGVYGRIFATHGVVKTTLNDDGSVKKKAAEYRPRFNIRKNYGMDIAVGGLGGKGIQDITITPDGRNGHVYMKMMPGGEKECGALLFGIEPSAPGKASLLGQSHDAKAVSSKQSPFLSHKRAAGDVIGGRTIDFSQMDGKSFANLLDGFDAYYRAVQNDPNRQPELHELNHALSGAQMGQGALEELMTERLGVSRENARSVYTQLRTPHVPRGERVQVEAPQKPPERPNFFKRWFSSFNRDWQEQNERYEQYVRERQAERIAQRNALDEALEAIPADWEKGQSVKLDSYLHAWKAVLKNSGSAHDRDMGLALMLQAVNHAVKSGKDDTTQSLTDIPIVPEKLDPDWAMKDPVFRYLQKNENKTMREALAMDDPSAKLLGMLHETTKTFSVPREEAAEKQRAMAELFRKLNVSDPESRSDEYRELVSAVGRMARKDTFLPTDGIRVFNAVQAYAAEKRIVPKSELGRESLSLAYEAMRTALPNASREKLMENLKPNIDKLERAMGRGEKAPEEALQQRKTARPKV